MYENSSVKHTVHRAPNFCMEISSTVSLTAHRAPKIISIIQQPVQIALLASRQYSYSRCNTLILKEACKIIDEMSEKLGSGSDYT